MTHDTRLVVPTGAASPNIARDESETALSEQEIKALIFKLLLELGKDLGTLAQMSAQNQADTVKISTAAADKAKADLDKYLEALEAAHSGVAGFFGKVFGNGLANTILMSILGALLCETPLGVAMLAATVALSVSGVLDKAADGLGNAMGGSEWAKFAATLIITVALTAGAGACETATFAESKAAAKGAEQGAKVAEEEAAKASTTLVRDRVATANVFSTVLLSQDPILHFLLAAGVDERTAKIISLVVNLIAAMASFGAAVKGAARGRSLGEYLATNALGRATNPVTLIILLQGAWGMAEAGYGMAAGINTMEQAGVQKKLAEIGAQLEKSGGVSKFANILFDTAQQAYKSLISKREVILETDFSLDWQVINQGFSEIAG